MWKIVEGVSLREFESSTPRWQMPPEGAQHPTGRSRRLCQAMHRTRAGYWVIYAGMSDVENSLLGVS
jgi:hypothetical protein